MDLKNNPKLTKSVSKNGHDLFVKNFRPESIGRDLIKYLKEITK
jgi:glycosyltransferase involved in cell wall biosynthesis